MMRIILPLKEVECRNDETGEPEIRFDYPDNAPHIRDCVKVEFNGKNYVFHLKDGVKDARAKP